MEATTPKRRQEFYSMLRERETQARAFGARHLCAVHDTNSMLYWLAKAAEDARDRAGRLQVHVAASASVNQSTIDRFEKHIAWPRDADRVINAYADDLDIASIHLWEEALRMWREDLEAAAEVDATTREIERGGDSAERQRDRA
jgi:hypothetical protein